LSDAPLEVAREAHDLLSSVAGDQAPAEPLGEDATARKKCRTAWEAWWQARGNKLDLAKLDIGLPWQNTGQRARAATSQFVNALVKGDDAALVRSVDFPFSLMGLVTLAKREDFDRVLGRPFRQQRPKLTFSPPRLGNLEEYLKTVQERDGGNFKAFLAKYPRAQLRVVYVTARQEGSNREEPAAFLVRLRGGRAKVIGLGEVRHVEKPK
jgi:hypothetical protein